METYLTIEELAKYLNYSEKTIRKWVLNRLIPFHKIGKNIRFRLSEIEKWVDGNGELQAGEENEIDESGLFSDTENVDMSHNALEGQGGDTAETGGEA
ncbi:helix-turn-helix domain-containing protein [Treponema sp. R80B11-R83G3]